MTGRCLGRRAKQGRREPRKLPPVGDLEGMDHVEKLSGERNIVEPLEQASSAQGMEGEGMLAAFDVGHHLAFQIDGNLGARLRAQLRADGRADVGIENYRNHAVLDAIVEEYIAEAWRNDRPDAEGRERIDRAFTRGAAAEILLRDDDTGLAVARLIEDEIRLLRAVGSKAQVVKQHLGKAR